MKIVDRKSFLQLPKGTVYSKFMPYEFWGFSIKISDPEEDGNEWVHIPLVDGFIKNNNHEITIDNYDYFEFDLDCSVRDGLYEKDQLFAIYDKDDVMKLIARLTYSFLEKDFN